MIFITLGDYLFYGDRGAAHSGSMKTACGQRRIYEHSGAAASAAQFIWICVEAAFELISES